MITLISDRERELMAQVAALKVDAAMYRWLSPRLLGADFDWNETGKCVLVFEWPGNVGIGGDCDKNIEAAMAVQP